MQTLTDRKGDAKAYKFNYSENRKPVDMTGYKVLAQFGDRTDDAKKIKKASFNVIGGADTQIRITDAPNGRFEVYINTGETLKFSKNAYIEVAIFTDGNNKDTIYYNEITLREPKIDWETIE